MAEAKKAVKKTVKEAEEPEVIAEVAEAKVEAPKAAKVTKAGPKSAKAVKDAEAEATRKEAAAQKAEAKPAKQHDNPPKRHGKKYRQAAELVDKTKQYELDEAIALAKKTAVVKFDASLEMHFNLGVDPKQADQMVRASVVLPAGTGKDKRVATITSDDDKLIAKIEKGQIDFDVLITTPDMMPKLAKLAKILGPKGLMPNPKSGTVTTDVDKAVKEAKGGKVEFRVDKQSIVHQAVGKVSFSDADLAKNIKALVAAVQKAKPASSKGTYIKAVSLTTSMGPGIRLDAAKLLAASSTKK